MSFSNNLNSFLNATRLPFTQARTLAPDSFREKGKILIKRDKKEKEKK